MQEIVDLEKQIVDLKDRRDKLIRESGLGVQELQRILAFRTPKRTLCQMLRELHDTTNGKQQEKVGKCLLIAKKMDSKLREHAGGLYMQNWYDGNGEFVDT